MRWLGFYFVVLLLAVKASDATGLIARHGCKDTCGEVSIPFPFGIGPGCFLDSRYEITCKGSKPFLSKYNVEVVAVAADSGDQSGFFRCSQTITVLIPTLKVCSSGAQGARISSIKSIDLRGSPYYFSTGKNDLLVHGCAGSIALLSQDQKLVAGCSTYCYNNNNSAVFRNQSCNGVECCQTKLSSVSPSSLQVYHIEFYGQASGQNCVEASLIQGTLISDKYDNIVPVVLIWGWISSQWPETDPDHVLCSRDEATNSTGCACKDRRFGNPYVDGGCQGGDYIMRGSCTLPLVDILCGSSYPPQGSYRPSE